MASVTVPIQDGFQGYVVETTNPGVALYVFVLAYMGLSFIMVAPLVIWGSRYDRKRRKVIEEKSLDAGSAVLNRKPTEVVDGAAVENSPDNSRPPNLPQMEHAAVGIISPPSQSAEKQQSQERSESVFRNFDLTASSPENEPDPNRAPIGGRDKPSTTQTELSMAARSSAVYSAATTSKIYTMQQAKAKNCGQLPNQRVQSGVWDVGGRRWKDRRPFGRVDVIRRAIESESRSHVASESASVNSRGINRRVTGAQQWQNMSDLASSVLDEQGYDGEVSGYGRGVLKNRRLNSRRSAKSTTSTRTSEKSVMPPLNADAISPNDAADAHDPGRITSLEVAPDSVELSVCCGPWALWRVRTIASAWEGLLELAAPNYETRRIISLAIPLTLGAVTEPLCRVVMTAFISRTLGTDSMVAFVLVFLLLRLTTEELAGAVVDAESTLILNALCSGQESSIYLSGQYVQLALLLQLLMTIPIFVIWVFYMGDVVNWLVSSSKIADLATHYTRVIIYRFLVQISSRTCAVVLHESGNENFDSSVGVFENIATMVTIACVVSFVDGVSLDTVGWIQVLIGCGGAVTKIAWSLYQGWLQPYLKGIFTNVALTNWLALQSIVFTALPLLVGTFLEFGEFEMLTISTRYLGPAEVATFAVLTLIWEVFQASTEGISEAASVRVAFHLGEGHPATAKISSFKVLFLSTLFSLISTSLIFLVGKNLAVALTNDFTLQHLLNESFTFLGLANIVLTISRVCWSLIGAQGRFRTATMVMLLSRWGVALPVSFVCVFALFLDLKAVVAAVTVGYATSCCALAYILFRSDWQRLAQSIQDLNATLSGVFDDFDESYDDSENSADRPASGNL